MERDARLFKALSDLTRLKLMVILTVSGETCVCRLTEALGVSESTVSRHLGVLRAQGLVKARREGTWMHYSVVSPPRWSAEASLQLFRHRVVVMPRNEAGVRKTVTKLMRNREARRWLKEG